MILEIKLKNCYGINKLRHTFDFKNCSSALIYAPNGTMKTSFAKTFKQLQKSERPKEQLYNNETECSISINKIEIKKEEIFVIQPYIEKHTEEFASTLLVNEDLKSQYDKAHQGILKLKKLFLKHLNEVSGLSTDSIEEAVLNDFEWQGDLFSFLREAVHSACNVDFSLYQNINYNDVFNDNVKKLLEDSNVLDNLRNYSEEYIKILKTVPFFNKDDGFNPSRAEQVLQSLITNKFFTYDNAIKLTGEDSLLKEEQLKERLATAKNELNTNSKLKAIEDKIVKTIRLKAFQKLILDNPAIINELLDLKELKKKIWSSYFAKYKDDINALLLSYDREKDELVRIESKANINETKWRAVIDIFKQRFDMPFDVDIINAKSAILGNVVPKIIFRFKDDASGKSNELDKETLENIDILSQGEKKALYLLNIIYAIESRVQCKDKTLFIIDDIADSFDYKNKYAIIQYLKELPEQLPDSFFQIILTHNFDFFRTVQERILTEQFKRGHSFVAQKEEHTITFVKAGEKNVVDPFTKWKLELKDKAIDQSTKLRIIIAMIAFVRQLVIYLDKDKKEEPYVVLTALLHAEESTKDITFTQLGKIYYDILNIDIDCTSEEKVFNKILAFAKDIREEPRESSLNLKNKIILSISTRLQAEYYMESEEVKLEKTIGKTFEKYKKKSKDNNLKEYNIKLMEQVVIMTPENIHINSFMYEPILDMSDGHLKKLNEEVSKLYENIQIKECFDILPNPANLARAS